MPSGRCGRCSSPLSGLISFGVLDHLPLEAGWFLLISIVLCTVWALIWGIRQFHRPTRDDALLRLDAALPGRPIAALRDTQAIGASDPRRRPSGTPTATAWPPALPPPNRSSPNLKLASRDPYGLRYMALTLLVVGLIFGSLWRVASISDLTPGNGALATTGPTWEGWAQPPAYTGKPTLYLTDQTDETLSLPIGTRINLRFYGDPGALILAETVSGRTEVTPASQPTQDFTVTQSGRLAIQGTGGREWLITVLPDQPPAIEPKGDNDARGGWPLQTGFHRHRRLRRARRAR